MGKKWKTYNCTTHKVEIIDEENTSDKEGLSFQEYLNKYGKTRDQLSDSFFKRFNIPSEPELEKLFSEIEIEDDNIEGKDI